ncbi:hypothetical protein [Nannocystis sp.]|uniref:hypothetical protein n=1 Tax=Nannocystis sp. TaxID=1962667 RepID=UPI0025FB04DE|nr:hypothetical protein [Nannocystis sp.]
MAEPTITVWRGGTVVDDEPSPRRPWSLIVGTLLVLWVLDLTLALTLPRPDAPPLAFDGASAARAELAAAAGAAGAEDAWLLIGDSVLAGDVMAGRIDGWEHERVVDAMRREQGPSTRARLFQVALDGLLPTDLLHLTRELDRIDPAGRVGLVVELNPRFFSRQYADLTTCTRPWLCELGAETITPEGHVRWDSLALDVLSDLRDAVAAIVPVYRHRRRIPPLQPDPARLLRPAADTGDALAARARLLAHYRDPAIDAEATQMTALRLVVQRLRGVGRRALFFTTPIADDFMAQAQSPAENGAYTAALSAVIDGDGADKRVTLVPLDDPGFHAQLFLDHCHLNPEGNRRLALNLLHALGLSLRQRPRTEELVHPEGFDRTLVGRATHGYVDGPGWQALFNGPRGVAVAPGGRRIVIADSDNHALRELVGDHYTVRTLVGAPERQGWRDGHVSQAMLDRPSAPWIAGDDVYFADQGGSTLRRVRSGIVSTLRPAQLEFTRIDQIQGHKGDLLILDDGRRLFRYNPRTGASRLLAVAEGKLRIAAFASAPDGRLWLAEREGQIWQARVGHLAKLGPRPDGVARVFPDTAAAYVPQRRGSLWPLRFDEVQLDRPVALTYVPRYDALLVADDVRARVPIADYHERVQLRLLDLAERRMYPWIHTQVASSYIYWNTNAEAYASTLHIGSLAFEPDSASLVYLERHRSRLLWLSDGIMATAKTSHTANIINAGGVRELMGNEAGIRALERFHPDHYLLRRVERLPRRGPFTGLLLSSSMSTMSQAIGPYSLARRLEQHLQDALGTRDGVRFDLAHRAYSSPLLEHFLEGTDRYTATGRPDVIFIEIHNFNNKLFRGDFTDDRLRSDLQRFADYAARSDALVVLFDNSGLISIEHDGLRASPEVVERAKTIARQMGMVVIELTDALLPRSLGEGVWGSPPLKGAHSTPHAIDATAALLAERSYPIVAAHLGPERTPALLRAAETPWVAADPGATLVGAFTEVAADWQTILPNVPGEAIQRERGPEGALLFVDLQVALGERRELSAAELERLAVASVYTTLVRDRSFADVTRASVRLAWFTRYDEYGAGVSTGASVVLQRELDREALTAHLQAASE